jgi:hypothetical protein
MEGRGPVPGKRVATALAVGGSVIRVTGVLGARAGTRTVGAARRLRKEFASAPAYGFVGVCIIIRTCPAGNPWEPSRCL